MTHVSDTRFIFSECVVHCPHLHGNELASRQICASKAEYNAFPGFAVLQCIFWLYYCLLMLYTFPSLQFENITVVERPPGAHLLTDIITGNRAYINHYLFIILCDVITSTCPDIKISFARFHCGRPCCLLLKFTWAGTCLHWMYWVRIKMIIVRQHTQMHFRDKLFLFWIQLHSNFVPWL